MRATPPSARICEGTRSSAMTATAPDLSAMTACSAVVTSIITPPLSISARPVLRRRLVGLPLLFDIVELWSCFSRIVKDGRLYAVGASLDFTTLGGIALGDPEPRSKASDKTVRPFDFAPGRAPHGQELGAFATRGQPGTAVPTFRLTLLGAHEAGGVICVPGAFVLGRLGIRAQGARHFRILGIVGGFGGDQC